MAKNMNPSPKKEKQKTKLSFRLSIPILLVVVIQLITFLATMAFGGEFRDIRQYAYDTLVEKTENRCNYIRTELQGKPALVQEYSEQINNLVAGILEENGAAISQLQMDKDLNCHRTVLRRTRQYHQTPACTGNTRFFKIYILFCFMGC